jgi:hypothetical protein
METGRSVTRTGSSLTMPGSITTLPVEGVTVARLLASLAGPSSDAIRGPMVAVRF